MRQQRPLLWLLATVLSVIVCGGSQIACAQGGTKASGLPYRSAWCITAPSRSSKASRLPADTSACRPEPHTGAHRAADAGLRRGDVIEEVHRCEVDNAAEYRQANRAGDGWVLLLVTAAATHASSRLNRNDRIMNRQQDPTQRPTTVGREIYSDAYQQGYNLTKRFLLSRGVPFESAEEDAQAAWVRGWERLDDLRNPDRLVTWINSIALNLFRNRLRKERLHDQSGEIPEVSDVKTASISADVFRELSRCKPSDQKLLWQRYVEGYTSAELATLWHCKPATIRVRLLRARRGLANTLGPMLRTDREHATSELARRSYRRRPNPLKEKNNESDSMAPTSAHSLV